MTERSPLELRAIRFDLALKLARALSELNHLDPGDPVDQDEAEALVQELDVATEVAVRAAMVPDGEPFSC